MSGPYDDIIHLPPPVSKKHPQMSRENRAAQFSPFAALTGHGAAIKETARLTDARIELSENTAAELDRRLDLLNTHIQQHPNISVTYFQPDVRKEGGSYVTVTGAVKKIDAYERVLLIMDGTKIAISDILTMDGDLFYNML